MKRYYQIFRALLKINNGKKWTILQMAVSSVLYNLVSLLPPVATAGIIAMITGQDFMGIWYYAGAYVVFYIVYWLLLAWNYRTYTLLANFYHMEVQKQLFQKISDNDSIISKVSRGKLLDTCSDDIRYLVDVINCFIESAANALKLVVIFVVFASYNWLVATIAISLDLFYLLMMSRNSRKVATAYEGVRKNEDKIIDIFSQILSNLRQVRTLNLMGNLDLSIEKTRKSWRQQYFRRRKHLTLRYCLIPAIVYFGKIALYVLMAAFVLQGKMTLDQLVLLISYFELAITCTDKLLTYLLDLSNHGVRLNRIKMVLDYVPAQPVTFGDVDNDDIEGAVEFKDVCFTIGKQLILDKVSFKACPHEITAIVGHSGSGKSTIINLLYRLGRIKSGEILVDKESIYNYTPEVYASNVAGVYQKPFMFDMSIRENLALVDRDPVAQVEACKRVGMHDFIESLPRGYNTVVSEDQHLFTEGQKQLLVIARALLSKAEVLLMDEVTSNVDVSATATINALLKDLKKEHTIILVTHKPEMMAIADRVVVMDHGKVTATGTNRSVLRKSSLYRELTNRTFASISTDKEE